MVHVRSIAPDELDLFARAGGDGSTDPRPRLTSLLAEGRTRPEWLFVALREGVPVGRVAFSADEPLEGPTPPMELSLFALELPWGEGHEQVADALLGAALPVVAGVAVPIDARVNVAVHSHVPQRRAVLEAAGLIVFQEKQGFLWQDRGQPLRAPARLSFQTIEEVGRDAYAAAMGASCAGTLDRNDRYYCGLVGHEQWGHEMLGYLADEDSRNWKLAFGPDGMLAGYVALSAFDDRPATATITHIGVHPAQRGHGYVDELLARATADARASGFGRILSDVDVVNAPMAAAMQRAGHERHPEWHVWHLRLPVRSGAG